MGARERDACRCETNRFCDVHPMGASETLTGTCPFCIGYRDALDGTVWDPTPREVETAYPAWSVSDVTRYINGVLDATAGETFRLNLDHAECQPAARTTAGR